MGQAAGDQAIEDEEDGRRAHVAVIAQHLALEVERSSERQRGFDRVDHLDAAGVRAEAVDCRANSRPIPASMEFDRRREVGFEEHRDRAVEDHREPGILDPPAHDAERRRPQMLARPLRWSPMPGSSTRADDSGGGAIAEQGGGDDRRGIVAVEADRDRAGFDGDEQPARARLGGGKPRGGGEAGHAAGASQSEDRHAADVGAQPERERVARVEAGGGDPGGGDGDDPVDVAWLKARLLDRAAGDVEEQSVGSFEIDAVALRPAVILAVPVDRGDDVALVDPGIVEYARQPVEQRLAPEQIACSVPWLRLALPTKGGTPTLSESRWAGCTKETSDAASSNASGAGRAGAGGVQRIGPGR